MKFRLFGGLDCPDFLLAQLSTVAALPPELITRCADHAIATILAPTSTAAEADVQNDEFMAQLLAEMPRVEGGKGGAEESESAVLLEAAQAVTAVHSVIQNAVRFGVPSNVCATELSMLGLSTEAIDAITGPVAACAAQLHRAQLLATPMLPGIADPVASVWVADGGDVSVRVAFTPSRTSAAKRTTVEMTPQQARALLAELVRGRRELSAENALAEQ